MKKIILAVALCLVSLPASAATKPTDVITILKIEGEYGEKEIIYTKLYSALVLSSQERAKIVAWNTKLDKEFSNFPNYHYRLTHLRVAGGEVQRILFQNKLGDTVVFSFDSGDSCSVNMGGNGGKGNCLKPFE